MTKERFEASIRKDDKHFAERVFEHYGLVLQPGDLQQLREKVAQGETQFIRIREGKDKIRIHEEHVVVLLHATSKGWEEIPIRFVLDPRSVNSPFVTALPFEEKSI